MRLKQKFFTSITFLTALGTCSSFAQETKSDFNKWSFEANVGTNKPVRPFGDGYSSSNTGSFVFTKVNHFDVGVRYMISPYFGLKIDYSQDKIDKQSDSRSMDFNTDYQRIGFQGVANIGRVLKFESFSQRLGLLAHGGFHVAQLDSPSLNLTDNLAGVILGITPQVKVTRWLAVTADVSYQQNFRQHLNWDGTRAGISENLTGSIINTSVGLTFYVGGKKEHADWYIEPVEDMGSYASSNELSILKQQFEDLQKKVDGIVIPNPNPNPNPNPAPEDKYAEFRSLSTKGLLDIFYDLNKTYPVEGSLNNLYYVLNFMKSNPDAKVKVIGYADSRGNQAANRKLSLDRANYVKNLLVAYGISEDRLVAEGKGFVKNTGKGKSGYDLNRRVTFELIE